MAALSDGVRVSVLHQKTGWRARVTVNGVEYGRPKSFENESAALIHVAQMLRVLATDLAEHGAAA